mmetsp:Transcript_6777/g.8195  ORF Transcript_6777/g.8195 Transcript_6777/m.8195 type:complete len:94 (+) Transcript_6777:65-346(+)
MEDNACDADASLFPSQLVRSEWEADCDIDQIREDTGTLANRFDTRLSESCHVHQRYRDPLTSYALEKSSAKSAAIEDRPKGERGISDDAVVQQ